MPHTEIQRLYSKTANEHSLWFVIKAWQQKESAQQRKIRQTEESASAQLSGDLFQFNSKALNQAASFGLVAMQEGWIAGGLFAKIILSRIKSGLHTVSKNNGLSKKAAEKAEALSTVDPSLSAQSLLRVREDFVKRGLIR